MTVGDDGGGGIIAVMIVGVIVLVMSLGGLLANKYTNKSWERWLVKEGHAIYEADQNGSVKWQLMPAYVPAEVEPQIYEVRGN